MDTGVVPNACTGATCQQQARHTRCARIAAVQRWRQTNVREGAGKGTRGEAHQEQSSDVLHVEREAI